MSKRVRVTVEMDSTFIRLLNANAVLSGLRERDELEPSDQLALVVLGEARGGLEAEVDALVLPTWRPHIDVMHDRREVIEE